MFKEKIGTEKQATNELTVNNPTYRDCYPKYDS